MSHFKWNFIFILSGFGICQDHPQTQTFKSDWPSIKGKEKSHLYSKRRCSAWNLTAGNTAEQTRKGKTSCGCFQSPSHCVDSTFVGDQKCPGTGHREKTPTNLSAERDDPLSSSHSPCLLCTGFKIWGLITLWSCILLSRKIFLLFTFKSEFGVE